GLIIFGTLLGSISDREKEIYTFSALGLSPQHVGVLFFAEAAVYAVVGGMGGQLLAQIVAQVMTWMQAAGWISMGEAINYSSTNALFAIGVVMATVLISAIYPAYRASKSANPGLARAWRMPAPEGDELSMVFPFTVSAYDITGVVSFLAEHFRRHDDAGLGNFAASNVRIGRNAAGNLELAAELALAPFDLGVTQELRLAAKPSEIEGVDEVAIDATRLSGAKGDWVRANKVFLQDLRKQFLLWRTLSNELIEHYRAQTLETIGLEDAAEDADATEHAGSTGGG
ncbi:MAG: ABC transporter permease, partial [Phycisphaeraceae bacterium]